MLITLLLKVKVSEFMSAQSCPTVCDHMDCSLPGFCIHGIFQARVLEWVAISNHFIMMKIASEGIHKIVIHIKILILA